MGAVGKLPLSTVLYQLRKLEVLQEIPPPGDRYLLDITTTEHTTIREVISQCERICGWIYDPEKKAFYEASATHRVDGPDSFGRPSGAVSASRTARPMISIGVRFRRLAGGASFDPVILDANASTVVVWASLPDGVEGSWNNNSERGYYDQVTDTESGRTFNTSRKVASSGVVVSALAARLPGGLYRVDGTLEVSSFVGGGLDRAVVHVPLQVDGKRGEWERVYLLHGGDITARAAFQRFGFTLGASGEAIEVCVRVE